jgi:hypothetical protein
MTRGCQSELAAGTCGDCNSERRHETGAEGASVERYGSARPQTSSSSSSSDAVVNLQLRCRHNAHEARRYFGAEIGAESSP